VRGIARRLCLDADCQPTADRQRHVLRGHLYRPGWLDGRREGLFRRGPLQPWHLRQWYDSFVRSFVCLFFCFFFFLELGSGLVLVWVWFVVLLLRKLCQHA
jgi:hypothetical protein